MKNAIVTGGANGIGRCITEYLIADGYFVFVIDTDMESGNHLIAERGLNQAFFYEGDIAEKEALDEFIEFVKEKNVPIHALINNACLNKGGIEDCSYDDFNYVLRVGVTAPFYLAKQLQPIFVQGASIVNISSTRAYMSQKNTESYTSAKGGISALTHGLSVSLAGKVRVNAINPGWIDTAEYQYPKREPFNSSESDRSQHPAGRIGRPEDIAEMVVFLCSDKAGFITGENITIDGGMTKQMIYHDDYGWKYEGGSGLK